MCLLFVFPSGAYLGPFQTSVSCKNSHRLVACEIFLQNIFPKFFFVHFPADLGRKLKVHNTFRIRLGSILNVLCTFNIVSTGIFSIHIREYAGQTKVGFICLYLVRTWMCTGHVKLLIFTVYLLE